MGEFDREVVDVITRASVCGANLTKRAFQVKPLQLAFGSALSDQDFRKRYSLHIAVSVVLAV